MLILGLLYHIPPWSFSLFLITFHHSDTLAARLSGDEAYQLEASLCYICSGNAAELLNCWSSDGEERLQELVERIMCLQSTSSAPLQGDKVVESLLKYSKILANQGQLSNALTYLSATPQVWEENGYWVLPHWVLQGYCRVLGTTGY
eukprot:sb/3473752/